MKYDFDQIIDRRNTYSVKWNVGKLGGSPDSNVHWNYETIPMMVADMDFLCPPALIKAMHRVADFGIYGYTSHETDSAYASSLINWYKDRYGTEIKEEEILYSDGSVEAVNGALRAFSSPGDGVIVCRPVYGHFNDSIENECCRRVISSHLINNGGYYTMDWEDFEAKCAVPTNRIFVLCSPANPVGRVWTKEELQKMAEICRKYNVILISDEVHSDLLRKGVRHNTILSVVQDKSNIVMITAINKAFNVAGLQCANVIIPDAQLRGVYKKGLGPKMPTPFAVAALIAAYGESADWLEALNNYLDDNIDFAINFLRENMPKVKVWRPEGTYMLWLDFREYGLCGAEIHNRIYIGANVMLQDGLVHDPDEGECFQRMCVSCARSVLKTALTRISEQFAEFRQVF